jgi:hypothetical protein
MTARDNFDRLIDSWLSDGPERLSDAAVDRFLGEFDTRSNGRPSWLPRRVTMSNFAVAAASVAAAILIVAVGIRLASDQGLPAAASSPSAPAPSTAAPSPSAPPPSATPLRLVRHRLVDGEVQLAVADPPWHFASWREFDRRMIGLDFYGRTRSGDMLFFADPNPIGADCEMNPPLADARAVADHILADPDVASSQPRQVRIAGVNALELDVALAAGAIEDCNGDTSLPITSDPRHPSKFAVLGDDQSHRIYLLDVPTGSTQVLAIVVSAANADFGRVIEAAGPVLDSILFNPSRAAPSPGASVESRKSVVQ